LILDKDDHLEKTTKKRASFKKNFNSPKKLTKRDIFLLKKKGKRVSKNGFFIIYRKNQLSYCRAVYFFPRWTGKAVKRNLFKRWSRHFVRKNKHFIGLDMLLGFEKKEKDFYKQMNYNQFCTGFESISKLII